MFCFMSYKIHKYIIFYLRPPMYIYRLQNVIGTRVTDSLIGDPNLFFGWFFGFTLFLSLECRSLDSEITDTMGHSDPVNGESTHGSNKKEIVKKGLILPRR